jgi:hypothetical protein
MSVVSKVLLKQHRTFAEFRADLELQSYRNDMQKIGLRQRLDLVQRFMAIAGQTTKRITDCAREPGTVLLVDMSDPNLNETDANVVFQVVFEQFHEAQPSFGQLAVFDEAHKVSAHVCLFVVFFSAIALLVSLPEVMILICVVFTYAVLDFLV